MAFVVVVQVFHPFETQALVFQLQFLSVFLDLVCYLAQVVDLKECLYSHQLQL